MVRSEKKYRVLIVDDESAIRATLGMALEDRGWEVAGAASAEEGLETFEADGFDLLFLDKDLPGMSGIDMLREVRKVDSSVAAIMMTGYASAESALDALNLRIDNYIEKPFDDIFDVVNVAERAIDRGKSRRGAAAAGNHFAKATEALRAASQQATAGPGASVVMAVSDAGERAWLEGKLGAAVIRTADTPAEALQMVQEANTDILILDSSISDDDLAHLITSAKDKRAALETVVLTQNADLTGIMQMIELGVAAVLKRPLSSAEFDEHIAPMLARLG